MGRSSQRELGIALLVGVLCAAACGGTVTNVGSIRGDAGSSDDANPLAPGLDGAPTTDSGASGDGTTDAHADCTTSQCVDFDGGILCEGDHGHRVCPGGTHAEACTCGGTAPSHWVDCAGCP